MESACIFGGSGGLDGWFYGCIPAVADA